MFYVTCCKSIGSYHRSHWIIHDGQNHFFAEFDNEEQLRFFAQTLGFTYILREIKKYDGHDPIAFFDMSLDIIEPIEGGFWSYKDLPMNVKPIKALSNGSIVTCYFRKRYDGKFIEFYRPNPNAKEVYHPLPLADHLAHVRIYGLY